jgi:competence protein ComEC
MIPKQMPFLWLFFPLAMGIFIADFLNIKIQVSWMLFVVFFTLFLGLHRMYVPKENPVYKLKQLLPFLVFLQIGQLLYQNVDPENQSLSVENIFLPGDKIIGSIATISKTSGTFQKCEVEVNRVIQYTDTVKARGRILVFVEDTLGVLSRKDVFVFQSDLELIENKNNPGEFDSRKFWKHKSINRVAFVAADQFKKIGLEHRKLMDVFVNWRESFSEIIDRYLAAGDENAVAKGLILGDRTSIDSEVSRKFGNTGAMHVLAVSGLHVAILVQILTFVLSLFKRWISKKRALLLALIIVWIYAALTGFSPSVARSALMFTLLAGSTLFEKNYIPLNSLALSAILLLVWNPHYLYDIGFQLSYLAMTGIFLFYQPLSKLFYAKWKWVRTAWEGTMVGIAAQIMTLPLTLFYFHQFPNYFILTNLGLMVFSFLVLAFGIALFALVWTPFIPKVIAFLLTFSLTAMLWIINFVDALPGSVSMAFVLQPWQVLFLFLLILSVFTALKLKRMNGLRITLFLATIWVTLLVFNRFERMNKMQICFVNDTNPTFIVQHKQQSFCFYVNNKTDKKVKYVSQAFQKVHAGQMHYYEISNQREVTLNFERNKLEIYREDNGYDILINGKRYFYATKDGYYKPNSTIITAPWIDEKLSTYSLAKGAVYFDY